MSYNPITTGGGTEADAQRVTIANDSTGVVSVDDNGSSITVDGTVDVTGVATEATLGGVLTESDFDTKVGSLTETAPATDTASSGLNGRLQRIAQRLTSLIAAIGSPFQAGGLIGNTSFGATQSGTWNITNVSGTVSLPTGAATAANQQTDALTDTELRATPVAISGTVTAGLSATDNAVLDTIASPVATVSATPLQRVAIFDDSDTQITSFGGNTQYTEGDTDATFTGNVLLAEGPSNTAKPIQVDANGHLIMHELTENIALPDGASNTRHVASDDAGNAIAYPAFGYHFNGTTWDRARGDTTNGLLVNLGSNNDVSVSSSALPSGASTAANQSTIIGHVDGIEGLLTTIDADTGNIDTSLNSIEAGYATEGSSLGSGVLLQGDDGTDRKNINVDATTGDVQVDVTNTVTVDGSGVTQPISAASLPLPSGAATAANQQTDALTDTELRASPVPVSGTVDLGATDNAVLNSIKTSVEVIDNANTTISSTDVVRVAIFDDSDSQVTSFGGGTQYTEDAAAPANPVGNAMMMERDDALAGITPIEGDWTHPYATAEGALWTQDFNSDAILSGVNTVAGAVSGSEVQVDIVTSTLPSGAATASNQNTIIGHVDGIETLLGTIDSDTSTLAGAVSAGQMQVDIVSDSADLLTNTNFADAFGTAGLADSQVMSVQGIASMTPLLVDATGQGDVPITLAGEEVTVNLGATDNAVLDSIDAAVNGTLTVGSHAVTNAGTFAVQESGDALTALQLIDDVIFTDDAAFTAGTSKVAAIGAVFDDTTTDSVDENDIGAVRMTADRILKVQPNDFLTPAGDSMVDDSNDALKVNIVAGAGSGGTSSADDADFTAGSTTGTPSMGVYESSPTSVTDGDMGIVGITSTRELRVNIASQAADVTIADGGNSITVDGTVTANLSATDNAVLDTIETNTDFGTVTGGGTETGALRVTLANNSTGVISVDDNGGSLTVDGTVTANLSATDNAVLDQIELNQDSQTAILGTIDTDTGNIATSVGVMDDWDNAASNGASVSGDVAHDAADAGEPVKIGFKAKAFDGTAPGTNVAEDDRVNAIATLEGRQYVETAHPNFWSVSVDYASAQTNATVKAAPGAGLKLYITDIYCSNGATAGNITLLDGSGGTVKWETYPAINGGGVFSPRQPIALTANTLLAITSTTVTTHSLTVCGYIAA